MEIKQEKVYKLNPSLPELQKELTYVKKTIKSQAYKPAKKVSEIDRIKTLEVRVLEYHDPVVFVKVYYKSIKALLKLEPAALQILFYIWYNMDQDKDKITIVGKKISEYTSLSRASIWRGLKSLIDNEFIYKSDIKYIYYINVNYMYNGDRDVLYKNMKTQ